MSVSDVIVAEAAKFHLPLAVVLPLVDAESGGNPQAVNGQYYGLLQLSPDYNGGHYTAAQLEDPTFNLEHGLGPVADAYRQLGSPGRPSLSQYDQILTHSGHDTWTGQFSSAAAQRYFEGVWARDEPGGAALDQLPRGSITGSTPIIGGADHIIGQGGNAIGSAAGAAGNAIDSTGAALGAVGDFVSDPIGHLTEGVQSYGWKVAIVLGALVLFLAAGRSLLVGGAR